MKTLTLLFCLFISSISLADAWDNLTHEEAMNLMDYLRENPYIFDFCDCCQDGGGEEGEPQQFTMQLVKVTHAKIVPCEWNDEYYSVVAEFQALASLIYDGNGRRIEIMPPPSDWKQSLTMYMNYTWGYNSESGMAKPLFESLDYHYVNKYGGRSCHPPFQYPTPKELSTVGKFKAYAQWWKRL